MTAGKLCLWLPAALTLAFLSLFHTGCTPRATSSASPPPPVVDPVPAQVKTSPPAPTSRPASQPASLPAPEVAPPLGEPREHYFAVQVLFATDRAWDDDEETFGGDRGDALQLGFCEVSIPEGHEVGELEEPGIFRSERPEKHVLLTDLVIANQEGFLRRLRAKVRGSERREIFVFVHGALTTFDHVALRTAQISYDISLDGVPVLYSWPTEGSVSGYLVDDANAEWTQPHLREFLRLLARRSGAERIHILAHSMGTGLVTKAIRELGRRDPDLARGTFDEIVLAAADLDSAVFARDIAPDVARAARRVTIYVSDRDRALSGSRSLHKYPRLGQSADLSAASANLANLDVVDVSDVTEGFIGHEYYAGNPRFLEELRAVLRGDSPDQRALRNDEGLYRLEPREDEE